MSEYSDRKKSLASRIPASASFRSHLRATSGRAAFLLRKAAFVFELLDPKILFSGGGSGSPGSSPPIIVNAGVSNAAPTVASPAAAFASTVTGTTTQLSVLGSDDSGESNLTYTWATTGSPPAPVTFSANGTNAAKNVTATFTRAGNYSFQVTITDTGGLSATSAVNVTVQQIAAVIAVNPATTFVDVDQQLRFTATEFDQFGNAMNNQPGLTWALASGSGKIDNGGNYTAPTLIGSATVIAIDNTLTGSATVSIQDPGPDITQAAAANPITVTNTTSNLSIQATDDDGNNTLSYQWSVLSQPNGAIGPTFSVNGNNQANNTTVTFHAAGTYQFLATVTDSTGLYATSTITVQVQQSLTSITIAPPASMKTSSTQQLTATARDQFGAAMSSQPTITWSVAGGGSISATGRYTSSSSTGARTVTASSGGINGSTPISVESSTAIIAAPAIVTGTTTTLTAIGMGAGGLGYNYEWSLVSGPSGAATPTASVNDSTGTSTVVTFYKAGTYTLEVQASYLLILQSSATITLTVDQTLKTIAVTPATASMNLSGHQQFTAVAYDQFGTVMGNPPYQWAVTSGGGNISGGGNYTPPAQSTVATITASSGSVSGSATVTVANAAPTVTQAANASPNNPTAPGHANLQVQATDDAGQPNLIYTWSVVGNPPGLVGFSENGTNGAQNTQVNVTNAGTYNFLVTVTDASGLSTTSSVSVTFSPSAQPTPVISIPIAQNINEGASLTFSSGNGNAISITNAAGATEQVTLSATNGLLTLGSTSGLTINSGTGANDSTVAFSGTVAQINAALAGLLFIPNPGDYGSAGIYISATTGGSAAISDVPITITQVNLPPAVATPAAASSMPVIGASTNLSVLGADDAGESNLTYSWSVTSKPAGAASPTFSLNSTNSAKNTVVTFSAAGNYTLLATITDAGGLSVTSSVSVTVNQTLTTISVTPSNASVAQGATQQFAAVGLDQFGQNMLAQPTFTWSSSGGGSVDSSGLYHAPGGTGSATVTATSGFVHGSTSVTIVSNGTAIATPSIVTGNTTTLSVLGGASSGVTYTWSVVIGPPGASTPTFSVNGSSAALSTTATFFKAGSYTFQVAIDNGSTTYQDVNVTVDQTLTTINVFPGSANLHENAHQQFAAVADDQFGNTMTSQPAFAWGVVSGGGAIDGSGQYTAPGSLSAGAATISASSGSVSGTASITIANAAPTVAVAAASTQSPVTGTSTLLTVLGADDGGESNLTYNWAVTGTPPAAVNFSLNGSNAARNTTAQFSRAGAYHFSVTISDAEGLTTSSSVTVVVDQTLTTLSITPPVPTMIQNSQQQFSAAAFDQFGNAMTTPLMVWSIDSGGGAITPSGLYTAPGNLGAVQLTAASGSVARSETITVINAAPTVDIPAAASTTTVTGTTVQLTVLGADDAGEPNLNYTWSATGSSPAAVVFSRNNSNASKNTTAVFTEPGNYQLLTTIIDAEGASVTSTVTVHVISTFSAIIVTPTRSTLERAASEQFSATAVDQFGVAIPSQPIFAWSTLGAIGSIDTTGFYTAPNAGIGYATIIATAGNISGSATVSLDDELSATIPSSQTTAPSQPIFLSNGNAISITDADPNTQSVPLTVTLSATGGVITLSQLNGLVLSSGTGSSDSSVTFTGNLASINTALHDLKFSPNSGFSGTANLAITIDETGLGQTPLTQSLNISVHAAAAPTGPSGNSTFIALSTTTGGNSVLTGILNQTLSSTTDSTSGSSGSGSSSTIFSQQPLTISPPATDDDTSVASAPASDSASTATALPPAPAATPAHSSAASVTAKVAGANSSSPQTTSIHTLLLTAPVIPDKLVCTVPDHVFEFLAADGPMLKNLDTVKTDMASQKSFKAVAGSATVVSFGASAAYLVWLLRGGSLMSSLLSIFPAWKSIDPLPVLESFEKSRKGRKDKTTDNDDESLESLVEKSNQTTEPPTPGELPPPDSTGNPS